MPFIRGKYYANPIAGEALEAERDKEAESLSNRDESTGDDDAQSKNIDPVRRIDIEITELVPAYSGMATKGFVARLHRIDSTMRETSNTLTSQPPEKRVFYDQGQLMDFLNNELSASGSGR
jgi:hypothetical protein